MSYIPHKVDLVLEQHEKHKHRYRLSLVIIDAAGIRMQENQPIMLSHDGLQRQNVPEKEYPYCIDMWTEDHVTSFLLAKELDILLPTFEGMNGRLLHNVYDMCISSQQVMFSLLKEDVARSQLTKTLSLKSYFSFLEEIKVYIPLKMCNGANSTSVICNLM
ncbi:unnamed protein product [Rotaria socialis]|uniref:Uncharacterized protein n=1 Tax=Rotaria socialis TaxID=392032 RepID=A0A820X230_9BILA|nr:unnamed protein product [Rotaria socialis]